MSDTIDSVLPNSQDTEQASHNTLTVNLRYVYESLKGPQSIRLLKLHPGIEDRISCSLMTLDLEAAPTYAAISYVWGDPTNAVTISVDGRNQPVTTNLRDVLRRVRHETEERIFWADAICINQDDLEERASQVKLMTSIFSTAQHVVAWLGNDNGDAQEVARFIHDIAKSIKDQNDAYGGMSHTPEISQQKLPRVKALPWPIVVKLLQQPFFSRCWIIQEMCLSKLIVVLYGDAVISWNDLLVLSGWVSLKAKLLFRWFDLDRLKSISTTMLPYKGLMPAHLDRNDIFVRTLARGRSYLATDPRDHVYALLSHPGAIWGGRLIIQPDYTRSVREVYIETAWQILSRTQNLNLLIQSGNRAEEVNTNDDIPSWVPPWSLRLIWMPFPGDENAAAGSEGAFNIAHSNGILKVRGIKFDTVVAHTQTLIGDDFRLPWAGIENIQRLLDEHRNILSRRYGDIWKAATISFTGGIIDRHLLESNDSAHYPAFWDYLWATSRTAAATAHDHTEGAAGGYFADIMSKASHVSRHRKFLVTAGKGYVGLGPRGMREGDICCVLFGAGVPYVLRRVGEGEDGLHVLVGEAYVLGWMRGEVVSAWRRGEGEVGWFGLR